MATSNNTESSRSETDGQMRPGLWHVVNERYPGSMIRKDDAVELVPLAKPISECRVSFVSTSGVQPRGTMPFDTVHPVGDYTFRRVPSSSHPDDLEIHQLKYITSGANRDLNCVFPIQRLQELAAEGIVGGLTENFYTFIGYNMAPELLEATLAENIAEAVVESERADVVVLAPA